MEDRGEKIVNLAREMLSSSRDANGYISYAPEPSNLTLKTLCLAMLLTAFGSSVVTHWIDENRRPINRYEKVELDALIFYTARIHSRDADAIRQGLLSRLSIESLDNINVNDFRRVRDLLRQDIP
jgi:hypothetical protein